MFRHSHNKYKLACFDDYIEYLSLKENDPIAFHNTYTELNSHEKMQYEELIPAIIKDLLALESIIKEGNENLQSKLQDAGAPTLLRMIKTASNHYAYDAFLKRMKEISMEMTLRPRTSFPENFMEHTLAWFHTHVFVNAVHSNASKLQRK